MALARVDQDELLTALHTNGTEWPLATFLDRFRRRVGAREAILLDYSERFGWLVDRARAGKGATITRRHREALLRLRPGRVYSLADVDPDVAEHGRVVRSSGVSGDQWLVAMRATADFGAAVSALMSNLAPHVHIACENRSRLKATTDDLAAASAAAERGGVGWALIDRHGGTVAGTSPPAHRRDLAMLAEAIAAGAPLAVRGRVLAVPRPVDGDRAAALMVFRTDRPPTDRSAVFAAEYAVPPSEARLADALGRGLSITQAAQQLGLTSETARNYSKRLYAQTGTRGQADLVRLLLTGLSPLV